MSIFKAKALLEQGFEAGGAQVRLGWRSVGRHLSPGVFQTAVSTTSFLNKLTDRMVVVTSF